MARIPKKPKANPSSSSRRADRLTTDLPFEEAVKRLLATPPPPKQPTKQEPEQKDERQAEPD